MNNMVLDMARRYVAAGLSVAPIRPDGTKAAAVEWRPYQQRRPTEAELRSWFGNGRRYGLAIIYGPASGNAELLDFDDAQTFEAFRAECELAAPGLIDCLALVRTPRPGFHLAYRCKEVEGNQKLALGLRHRQPKAIIETRGTGGYALCPGCPPECNPNPAGRLYEHVGGPPLTELPTISPVERSILFRVARSFNELIEDEPLQQSNGRQRDGLSPGDDYNARTTWEEILEPHGWVKNHSRGNVAYWRRPGKDAGWSATSGNVSQSGNELFCCFSDNAHPFQGARGTKPCSTYTKFAAYVLLNHGGDFHVAARELGRQGYGKPAVSHSPKAAGSRKSVTATPPIEPYKPFPVEALPAVVGDYVSAASTAIGCDASYIALPLLGCLGRTIGNRRVIRLKPTWQEPAIIWAAIIGKSGTHKTPALQTAMQFLNRKQAEAIAQHVEAMAQYEQEKSLYDRDYALWKRSKRAQTGPPPWPLQEPVCERYATTDVTIEALAALLAVQFDGLLVLRDELAGWLGGIAEYKGGKGSDLGHWLASWSGVPLTVDRKTAAQRMLYIPRASVSIVGGIQLGVLRQAIGREHMQDGLCARLLLAMPETRPVKWSERTIDPPTEAAMQHVFDGLLSLNPAAAEDDKPVPFSLDMTREAKAVWIDYYNRHRAELADLDDDLAAAWSKLEAYTARFALVFQLCSWAAEEQYAGAHTIDQAAMHSAITLSDWFGGEARRVYAMFSEDETDREARELVELIGKRGGRITARGLAHASRRYRGARAAEDALGELVEAGYGVWEVVSTATNKRREFKLITAGNGNGFA